MLNDMNILKLASAFARYASDRHQLLAQNVANADTNNYKAKDLEPFAEAYERHSAEALSGNGRNGEFRSEPPWRTEVMRSTGAASPNGNTVSIEDQMMRSVEAQQDFEAATAIYRKTMDILRASLGRNA